MESSAAAARRQRVMVRIGAHGIAEEQWRLLCFDNEAMPQLCALDDDELSRRAFETRKSFDELTNVLRQYQQSHVSISCKYSNPQSFCLEFVMDGVIVQRDFPSDRSVEALFDAARALNIPPVVRFMQVDDPTPSRAPLWLVHTPIALLGGSCPAGHGAMIYRALETLGMRELPSYKWTPSMQTGRLVEVLELAHSVKPILRCTGSANLIGAQLAAGSADGSSVGLESAWRVGCSASNLIVVMCASGYEMPVAWTRTDSTKLQKLDLMPLLPQSTQTALKQTFSQDDVLLEQVCTSDDTMAHFCVGGTNSPALILTFRMADWTFVDVMELSQPAYCQMASVSGGVASLMVYSKTLPEVPGGDIPGSELVVYKWAPSSCTWQRPLRPISVSSSARRPVTWPPRTAGVDLAFFLSGEHSCPNRPNLNGLSFLLADFWPRTLSQRRDRRRRSSMSPDETQEKDSRCGSRGVTVRAIPLFGRRFGQAARAPRSQMGMSRVAAANT